MYSKLNNTESKIISKITPGDNVLMNMRDHQWKCAFFLCGPESTRLLHGNAPRRTCPGGCKDANETIGVSTSLPIATWNCAGHSNLTNTIYKELEFDIFGITETQGWQGDPARSTQRYLRREHIDTPLRIWILETGLFILEAGRLSRVWLTDKKAVKSVFHFKYLGL